MLVAPHDLRPGKICALSPWISVKAMMCTAAAFIAQSSTESLYCAVLLPRHLGQQHKPGGQTKLMKTHSQLTPFVVILQGTNDRNCGSFKAG